MCILLEALSIGAVWVRRGCSADVGSDPNGSYLNVLLLGSQPFNRVGRCAN